MYTPEAAAVTLTDTVQLPLAGMVSPVRLNEVSPAIGAKVPPVQPAPVILAVGGLATCTPEGNGSEKATCVRAVPALGFVKVNVSVEVPPAPIVAGLKTLAIVGKEGVVQVVGVPVNVTSSILKVSSAPLFAPAPA